MSFYTEVDTRRKAWQPVSPIQQEFAVKGAENTVSRAFALRLLELPVKEFIIEGLSRADSQGLGEDGKACLMRNTQDEERHDTALNNCVSVYADYNKQDEVTAKQILAAWNSLEDHPILKVACMENGVFFVLLPILRQFAGPSARTTALDISADEVLHVQSHRYASKELNQRPSLKLDNLRKATVAWMVEKLNVAGYTKEQFMKASDNLMYKGIAPELNFTKTYTVPSFFEKNNSVLPYYN